MDFPASAFQFPKCSKTQPTCKGAARIGMSHELAVASSIQQQLTAYARSRFGDASPRVPLSFALSQLAQLLSRYTNGVTETIVHSETQSAFDEYRKLLSGGAKQRLMLYDIVNGTRLERDVAERAVIEVQIVRLETRSTLMLILSDSISDDLDDDDDAPPSLASSASVQLACYLHRSFVAMTQPTSLPPFFSAGRRLRMTNLTFSRTASSLNSTSLHLLPTPYVVPLLDPFRNADDRIRLAAFSPRALAESLESLQTAIEMAAELDDAPPTAAKSTLFTPEFHALPKMVVRAVHIGAVRPSKNRAHRQQRRVLLCDTAGDGALSGSSTLRGSLPLLLYDDDDYLVSLFQRGDTLAIEALRLVRNSHSTDLSDAHAELSVDTRIVLLASAPRAIVSGSQAVSSNTPLAATQASQMTQNTQATTDDLSSMLTGTLDQEYSTQWTSYEQMTPNMVNITALVRLLDAKLEHPIDGPPVPIIGPHAVAAANCSTPKQNTLDAFLVRSAKSIFDDDDDDEQGAQGGLLDRRWLEACCLKLLVADLTSAHNECFEIHVRHLNQLTGLLTARPGQVLLFHGLRTATSMGSFPQTQREMLNCELKSLSSNRPFSTEGDSRWFYNMSLLDSPLMSPILFPTSDLGHVVQSEPLSCFVHAAIADIRLLTTNQLLVPVHLLCGHTLVRKQGEIPLECSFCGVGVISIDQQSQLSSDCRFVLDDGRASLACVVLPSAFTSMLQLSADDDDSPLNASSAQLLGREFLFRLSRLPSTTSEYRIDQVCAANLNNLISHALVKK